MDTYLTFYVLQYTYVHLVKERFWFSHLHTFYTLLPTFSILVESRLETKLCFSLYRCSLDTCIQDLWIWIYPWIPT